MLKLNKACLILSHVRSVGYNEVPTRGYHDRQTETLVNAVTSPQTHLNGYSISMLSENMNII